MILTNKQEEALKLAVKRYNDGEAYTCIAGFAGTGKSTLVNFIISALHINPDYVSYVAYTGKASLVLKQKGCPNATTAHKLLYDSIPKKDGTFYHIPKNPLDRPYKIIVVDEVSMLPKTLWDLLLSHHIHVLALGDPFQLPPIGEDNGILQHPHIFLDEIMRQEAESEIIRLTMDIRNNKPLELFKGEEVQVINSTDLVNGMYTWADQIIVGKNATRHNINYQVRKMIFDIEDNMPVDQDKIICLKNDWQTINAEGNVLVNGLIGKIVNPVVKEDIPFVDKFVRAGFLPDGSDDDIKGTFPNLNMDYKIFSNFETTITADNFRRVPTLFHPKQFDYGYAITCHKSQGSQYEKVLVLEEYLKGSYEDHARWLYTACTRAEKKLVVVRDYR